MNDSRSSVLNTKMAILFGIAVLLAVVTGTSASYSLCSIRWERFLDCEGKRLSMPPPGYWPEITILDLSNNTLTDLPTRSFSGFPALESLYLHKNSLTELNFEEFVNNTNLTSVRIEDNQINILTPTSRGTTLQNLRSILAFNNRISHLNPDFFSFTPNLVFLDMRNNHVLVEPGHSLLNHPKLGSFHVTFGGTGLKVVDSNLLAGLPNLEILELAFANISSVEGAFVNNKRLFILYLQGNAITRITPGTFPAEKGLKKLTLQGNPLNRLDPAAVNETMYRGGTIDISDTPVGCECGNGALFRWARSERITIRAFCKGRDNCYFSAPP